MGDRRKVGVEKSIVGVNFLLHIPVQFSISTKPRIVKEWNRHLKKLKNQSGLKINASEILRKKILEDLKVRNESELLRKHPAIREEVLKLRHAIITELGLFSSQFSKWGESKMLEEMER